jgi:uncharacterized protein YcfJ
VNELDDFIGVPRSKEKVFGKGRAAKVNHIIGSCAGFSRTNGTSCEHTSNATIDSTCRSVYRKNISTQVAISPAVVG